MAVVCGWEEVGDGKGEDPVLRGVVVVEDRGDVLAGAGVRPTGGSSRRPAVSGSKARPMRWRTSWLVPQVIPAASAIPSTATTTRRTGRRRALMVRPAGT
jgi:hypothetical protein